MKSRPVQRATSITSGLNHSAEDGAICRVVVFPLLTVYGKTIFQRSPKVVEVVRFQLDPIALHRFEPTSARKVVRGFDHTITIVVTG